LSRRTRKESDYNRGLAPPIRWTRLACSALFAPVTPLWEWASRGWRRNWMRPLLIGLLAVALLWPLDGWLYAVISGARHRLPGDLRRELGAIQQFGQGGAMILTVLLIVSLDSRGASRLWDWAAGVALAAAIVYPMKMLLGRPRPGLGAELPVAGSHPGTTAAGPELAFQHPPDSTARFAAYYTPDTFLGPFGQHPFDPPTGTRHAWEFWADISADLWSMPSAHTAYAVVMAVFLGSVYPRIAWLMWLLAALVGVARVLFAAHYPTDVAAGAAIGAAASLAAVRSQLGQRLIHRFLPTPSPSTEPPRPAVSHPPYTNPR